MESNAPLQNEKVPTPKNIKGEIAADRWKGLERRTSEKGKGRDLGYALAASSCEGAISVEYAPSRPSMRSLLSQFQTPTTPRRAVGFFGSGRSLGRPNELITQLTLD
jgi:hypothetical protein